MDPDPSKAAEARQLGARELISFDAFTAAESEGRFDLVLNTAPVDLEKGAKEGGGFALLRPLAANGTFVQVGIPGGNAQAKARARSRLSPLEKAGKRGCRRRSGAHPRRSSF